MITVVNKNYVEKASVPRLSLEQMMLVDRLMVNEYYIEHVQMMENTGRNLASLAKSYFFNYSVENKKVLVLSGTGANGGSAIVAARRLKSWGYDVTLVLTRNPNEIKNVTKKQLTSIENFDIPVFSDVSPVSELEFDLIIDGIIGYNLFGEPVGKAQKYIHFANEYDCPVLSLDIPSGIHADKGIISDKHIIAAVTMAVALPKKGIFEESARRYAGDLFLADIGVPNELYYHPCLRIDTTNLFIEDEIIKII
jgi:NAD(P)H-hydrate epimerase